MHIRFPFILICAAFLSISANAFVDTNALHSSVARYFEVPFRARIDQPVLLPPAQNQNRLLLSYDNIFNFKPKSGLHSKILRDYQNRLPEEFKVPTELSSRVSFWLRVYTEWTSKHIVFFDETHPEVIHAVLDLRDLEKKSRNAVVFEILAKRKIAKKRAEILDAIRTGKWKPPIGHPHDRKFWSKGLKTQWGQRDAIIYGIADGYNHLEEMEDLFASEGVPPLLTRLALVESSLNINAESRKGAVGVWQFLEKSAQEYLHVNLKSGIDERKSAYKSTLAAAKLLKKNFKLLRGWPLAVTAYHHGYRAFIPFRTVPFETHEQLKYFEPNCTIEKKKSKEVLGLGWASKNYFSEFLAVLLAERYSDHHYGTFFPKNKILTISHKNISRTKINDVLVKYSISRETLNSFNPEILKTASELPANFTFILPSAESVVSQVKYDPFNEAVL